MNTLARGQGEMLLLEPCMVLQSKNTTDPAGRHGLDAALLHQQLQADRIRHAVLLLLSDCL